MAIPERQLETWASQGAIATSSSTYQTIRNVGVSIPSLGWRLG